MSLNVSRSAGEPVIGVPGGPGMSDAHLRAVVADLVANRPDPTVPVPVPTTERGRLRVKARHALIRMACHSFAACDRVFGDREGGGFGVLMYHRCCPSAGGPDAPTLNVTPDQLRAQLAGLKARGAVFRSLPSVIADREAGRPVPRETVVVTFDDGFACVARHALPVLQELNVPASVFICTGLVDNGGPMPFDPWGMRMAGRVPEDSYRSVSAREVRTMLDSGLIDVGAHTHSHADFRGRPSELRDDLARCAAVLKMRWNIERPTFAFPFGTPSLGFADARLRDAAKAAGMSCSLTSECRINDVTGDPYRWGRLNVFEWDTAATLQARLHGWYSWMPRAWGKLRRLGGLAFPDRTIPAEGGR